MPAPRRIRGQSLEPKSNVSQRSSGLTKVGAQSARRGQL